MVWFVIVRGVVFRIGNNNCIGLLFSILLTEVKNKILTMPEDTVLYPGHGKETTVRHEKNTNPYFNMPSK